MWQTESAGELALTSPRLRGDGRGDGPRGRAGRQACAVTDTEGQVLELDEAFEQVFGVKLADARGMPLAELIIAPRFRAAYRASLRQATNMGASPHVQRTTEFSVLDADGDEFPVELSISSDNPSRIATRVSVPGALETLDANGARGSPLHRQIEELAGIGSWEFDHTRALEWSENLFRLLGLDPGQVDPSFAYLAAHAHADDRERVLRAGDELGRSGRPPQLRFRYVLPDGRVRHLEAATAAASSRRGSRERTVGTLRDLTEQRVAEQELAARSAVSDLLANWQRGDPFLRRLLRDVGEPLEFEVGAMWVRRGDARVVRASWLAPEFAHAGFDGQTREARRPLKAGLIGAAWETGRPVAVVALPHNPDRADWLRPDLQGALALPATVGDEVLAVLSFASRDKVELKDRLVRSLTGIGHELGHFFAHRRGELNAGPLTPRELEVLGLVADGGSRSEVAERLHVSESTIKTHLEHIYDKLGAHDRAAAVGAAMRQGLIA